MTYNVRILINDLVGAARALYQFKVVAAGYAYATLELSEDQVTILSKHNITWQYD